MKQILIAGLVLCLGLSSNVWASNVEFKIIRVPELKAMLADSKVPVNIYDANGAKTRKVQGVISGAKLLSSFEDYEVAKELPSDLKARLVFYCYNEMCTSSHTAAKRAMKAGYTDVSVLSDGIIGWKMSGGQVGQVQ